ncbi:MAG: hypothetical protein ACKV19_22315 [Verrucomicrobiales bacterium]
MNTSISADALRRAASIRDQIDQLESEYKAILAGESAPARRGRKPAQKIARRPGRPAKAEAPVVATKKTRKKKRKLSPEARARIVAAVKARWARERAKG